MRKLRKIGAKLVPYLLIAPTCVFLFFFLYGAANGVIQGLGYLPYLGMTELTLEYYATVLTRSDLASGIQFSLYLASVTCAISTVLGVALSAMLCQTKASRVVQLFTTRVPMYTATLIVALAVTTLFTPTGMVPRLLFAVGIIDDYSQWPSVIANNSGYGIILSYAWRELAFIAYFTFSIMSHISGTYSEAARTLGASNLRVFFSVTLPLCKGTILRAALIIFASVFGGYEVALLLGPTLPKALPVLAYYEFSKLDMVNQTYGMALNGIATFICFALAIVYNIVATRERKEQDRG